MEKLVNFTDLCNEKEKKTFLEKLSSKNIRIN